MTEGTKYHPLFEYLLFSGRGRLAMTFAEIEEVIGDRLPLSARKREEWWSNSQNGHSQARAWMRASYKTLKVNLAQQTVEFMLDGWPDGYVSSNMDERVWSSSATGLAERSQADYQAPEPGGLGREHPLFGVWEGKVTLIVGYDYAQPIFEADAQS